MKKSSRKIFSLALCAALVFALLPATAITASAAGTPTGTIRLGTSGITTGNTVCFGQYSTYKVPWIVLDGSILSQTTGTGLPLLSEYLLGGSEFQPGSSGYYSGSALQTTMDNLFTTILTTQEQGAVSGTTLWGASMYTGQSDLNGQKLFPLSEDEAHNSYYSSSNLLLAKYITAQTSGAGWWWLRTSSYAEHARTVDDHGGFVDDAVGNTYGARPAFYLNPVSVLFSSAAEGGKSSGAAGADALAAVSTTTPSAWKLTLKDSSRAFAVTETSASARPGGTVMLNYTGATVYDSVSAPNEYISAMLVNASDGILYYGRLAQPVSVDGTVDVAVPSGLTGGSYTIKLFSEQYNGDGKTDYASAFSDMALTVDGTAPAVSSVTPSGTGAPISGSIAITFSETMDATAGTVTLNSGTALTGGSWSSDSKTYTVPYSALAYGTAYTATVLDFKDTAGNIMAADSTHTFTTMSEPDTTPPAVSSMTPSGTGAPISGNIAITFSEAMGATAGTVTLNGGTALTGGSWSGDLKTYTVPYSALAYGTAYTVTVLDFKDTAGNIMAADSTHTFTTMSEPDTTPPAVSSMTPSGTGAPISGNIAITFSEAMGATAGTVTLNGGAALTGGSWSPDHTVYTVPYYGLANGTVYTVSISGFADASGNGMPAQSRNFTTVSMASADSEPSYIPRTLTDRATGVTLTGNSIHKLAKLTVSPLALHPGDPACDAIRKAQVAGQVILGFNISLTPAAEGPLTISIPVGSRYDGRIVTILHCINGKLESIDAVVMNGMATFTVNELSPFAVTSGVLIPETTVTSPPKTGDAAGTWGFAVIGLAACAGYVVMRLRRA